VIGTPGFGGEKKLRGWSAMMSDEGTVACVRGSVRLSLASAVEQHLESDLTDGCFARGGWVVGRVGQLSGDGGRVAENGCSKVSLGGSRVGIPAESRSSLLARGWIWRQITAQRRGEQCRTGLRAEFAGNGFGARKTGCQRLGSGGRVLGLACEHVRRQRAGTVGIMAARMAGGGDQYS
jgi:hypothetical protein